MNDVHIIGRLTRDPELEYSKKETAYLRFTVAVDRFLKDKGKETDWIKCVAWGKTAENIAKYEKKGSTIAIIGNIKTSSYEKDGKTYHTQEVMVDKAEFIKGSTDQSNVKNTNIIPPKFDDFDNVDMDIPF